MKIFIITVAVVIIYSFKMANNLVFPILSTFCISTLFIFFSSYLVSRSLI
jgi:hypothetical protein